jgi:hypothetical protein
MLAPPTIAECWTIWAPSLCLHYLSLYSHLLPPLIPTLSTPLPPFPFLSTVYCTRTFELYFPCRSLLLLGKSLQPLAALLGHYCTAMTETGPSGMCHSISLDFRLKGISHWTRTKEQHFHYILLEINILFSEACKVKLGKPFYFIVFFKYCK